MKAFKYTIELTNQRGGIDLWVGGWVVGVHKGFGFGSWKIDTKGGFVKRWWAGWFHVQRYFPGRNATPWAIDRKNG